MLAVSVMSVALCGCNGFIAVPNSLELTAREESAFLLENPGVQKEVHATKGQAASWDASFSWLRGRPFMKERLPKNSESMVIFPQFPMTVSRQDAGPIASRVLARATSSQRVRLMQIALRALGPDALAKPDVLQELAVDPRQRAEILKVVSEARQFMRREADRLASVVNVIEEDSARESDMPSDIVMRAFRSGPAARRSKGSVKTL